MNDHLEHESLNLQTEVKEDRICPNCSSRLIRSTSKHYSLVDSFGVLVVCLFIWGLLFVFLSVAGVSQLMTKGGIVFLIGLPLVSWLIIRNFVGYEISTNWVCANCKFDEGEKKC